MRLYLWIWWTGNFLETEDIELGVMLRYKHDILFIWTKVENKLTGF